MNATTPSCAPGAPLSVRRLGPHHFAHLLACAEGLDLADCARRYLGTQHGHEAFTAHRQAVDAVRAVARQHGESAWRLVGLRIQTPSGSARPLLDEFVAACGLEGFGEAEVLRLYQEAWPADRRGAPAHALAGAAAPP